MTLRAYLIIMGAMTIISWLVFTYIIFNINPEKTNWIGFLMFYASLAISLIGTAALIGFIVRFVFLRKAVVFYSVRNAFRQSIFFSFFIITVLLLLSKNLFSWLNVVILIIGISILEYFILNYSKHQEEEINNEINNNNVSL